MQEQARRDGVIELGINFSAFTSDVVCGYVFGGSLGLLKDPRRASEWKDTISAVAVLTPLIKQFSWIIPTAKRIPTNILRLFVPDLTRLLELHKVGKKNAGDLGRACGTCWNLPQ